MHCRLKPIKIVLNRAKIKFVVFGSMHSVSRDASVGFFRDKPAQVIRVPTSAAIRNGNGDCQTGSTIFMRRDDVADKSQRLPRVSRAPNPER